MLIAGLGVGPTMAIFTLIVQNDVPFARLGTATSDLTCSARSVRRWG